MLQELARMLVRFPARSILLLLLLLLPHSRHFVCMFINMYLLLSSIFRLSQFFLLPVILFAPTLSLPHRFNNYFQYNCQIDQERCLFMLMLVLMVAL